MLVELDDEHTKCSICVNEFSCDNDSTNPEIRKRLTVLSSSQRCDHWFCHDCILREQQRVAEDNNGRVPKWIRCMICREKTSFNPAEPKHHRLLIDLLGRAQQYEQRAEKEKDSVQWTNPAAMLVGLDDEHTKCSICVNEFSCDNDSTNPEIRKRLPVLSSSQRCDHWFCHDCILREQQRVAEDNNGRVPKWIRCMICREKTSFNPAEPKYHRLLIDLLGRAQQYELRAEKEKEKEKELKKKLNDEINRFLSAWLLHPDNVRSNPIEAATPTSEAKEWLSEQLGVDRTRIDSWFYRRRKKLKKQHLVDGEGQASSQSMIAAGPMTNPQLQVLSQPPIQAGAPSIAKPPTAVQNPYLNFPSEHLSRPQNQNTLTMRTQVSMSVNQRLPSAVQSQVAVGESVGAQPSSTSVASSKTMGLSDYAKQYLTQWLLKTSNPYPSKELKDKIMAHFGIENKASLDGFLTRTRKKLNLQNKQKAYDDSPRRTFLELESAVAIETNQLDMTVESEPAASTFAAAASDNTSESESADKNLVKTEAAHVAAVIAKNRELSMSKRRRRRDIGMG